MRHLGILPHGRHLQTPDWEGQMWGDPAAGKFGTMSATLALALGQFSDNEPVRVIAIATGASQKADGTGEAVAMRELALERLAVVMRELTLDRLPQMGKFAGLRDHPVLTDPVRLKSFADHIEAIIKIGHVKTINTRQELTLASQIFDEHDVRNAVHVTSSSHAPRCAQLVAELRAEGAINTERRWMLLADDMTYPGSTAKETLIIEVPHRGDDPALGLEISAYEAFEGYFGMSAPNKDELHRQIRSFVKKHVPKQARLER